MSDLYFTENGHLYKSHDYSPHQINWISGTAIVEMFAEIFDEKEMARKCSNGETKTKKYLGLSPVEILDVWHTENKRSTDAGSKYHLQKERKLISQPLQKREGLIYPVYPPIMLGDKKLSIPQKLEEGIYPEHLMYLMSAGICGQADRVEIIQKYIDIYDHKTNKKLEFESFKNRLGQSKKMMRILRHLDDCNFIHYSIQLSIYMYMVRKHNYNLTPRKLILEHATFEIEKVDKYGFPTYYTDSEGNPIVKDVTEHKVDYLEKEVIAIINYLKDNPDIVTAFKAKKHERN